MNKKVLLAAQMVANTNSGVDPFEVVESVLASVTATKFPAGVDLHVSIDRRTGEYDTFRRWTVVPDDTDLNTLPPEVAVNQLPLSRAQQHDTRLQPGDIFEEKVASVDFSRIDIRTARMKMNKEIKRAEANRVVEAYRPRIGEVVRGVVRRQPLSREGMTLELDDGVEVFLPTEEMIPKEEIRLNDRIYACLYKVETTPKGPQLLISRTAPELLVGLFKLKVLEIEAGVIDIKAVARDAGSRSKVAVKTNDGRLNPIGTCIGRSGERVQAISNELNEEHIDIILWDENPAQLAINAIAPAEVVSITMDEDTHTMDIVVKNEDLKRAIGRNGQNVRLASEITGWVLNIMTEEAAQQKLETESTKLKHFFMEKLSISDELSSALVAHEFSTLEEIAYVEPEKLVGLPTLSNATDVENLQNQVKDLLLIQALALDSFSEDVSENETLQALFPHEPELLNALSTHGITTREELAELSIDDLLEITPLTRQQAGEIIMKARAHWFKKN
jgi:N utilization substance protein A